MRDIKVLAIIVLVGIIIFMRACEPQPPPQNPIIDKSIDTLWRDSIVKVPEYVPKIEYRDSLVEVPQNVDTAAIIKDYFSAYHYLDTIWIDTIGYVAITDVIGGNRIQSRDVVKKYSIPTIYENTTITLPPELKTKVFAGFNVMAPVIGIGPEITLTTKQDAMYRLGAGASPYGFYGSFGMSWKIRLKR